MDELLDNDKVILIFTKRGPRAFRIDHTLIDLIQFNKKSEKILVFQFE